MAVSTFNPQAFGSGTDSLRMDVSSGSSNWQTMHDATTADSTGGNPSLVVDQMSDSGNQSMQRCLMPFDTSSLSDGATISSAVLSLWVDLAQDDTGSSATHIVGPTTQASTSSVSTSDWDNVGGSSVGSLANSLFVTGQYNDITITDLSVISKTGFTLLGLRASNDWYNLRVAGNTNQIRINQSNLPVLTITYTSTSSSVSPSASPSVSPSKSPSVSPSKSPSVSPSVSPSSPGDAFFPFLIID